MMTAQTLVGENPGPVVIVRATLTSVDEFDAAHFRVLNEDARTEEQKRVKVELPYAAWIWLNRPGFLEITVKRARP